MAARGRFDADRPSSAAPGSPAGAVRPLTVAVTRVLSGTDPVLERDVVAAALDALCAGVSWPIAQLVRAIVNRLPDLPLDGGAPPSRAGVTMTEALPSWLPASRAMGGFYVLRALGAGAVGSVFVVTRIEEKGDPAAERLALKVPEYSASAARSLSEAEFSRMFRDEASALLALPQHPNLARFVTFDAGTRPKPILVMEFVEGVTLERLIETGELDASRALKILDDVLRGLEAMHAAGVGHLDVKPSNVVLRRGEEAVLVDFGLAGRHVRPGCATGPYGAPEVWTAEESQPPASPAKTDVYALGCVAFEMLTGRTLFAADNDVMQVAMHITHDGFPPPLKALAATPALTPIAELLFATLRRRPEDRPTASAVRKELARVAAGLAGFPWPIDAR
jgi:serine/threonine protein kinase